MLKELQIPTTQYYGLEVLRLAPDARRSNYRTLTGITVPNWDPSRLIKRWQASPADTTGGLEDPFLYTVYQRDPNSGVLERQRITTTNREALAPINLPGHNPLQTYWVPPTQAYITGPNGTSVLPAENLTYWNEAEALRERLQPMFDSLAEESPDESFTLIIEEQVYAGVYTLVYPVNEPRRIWNLVAIPQNANTQRKHDPRISFNAGRLLVQRHADGLNNSGRWVLDKSSFPGVTNMNFGFRWVYSGPQDTGEWDFRPELPIPMRGMYSWETVVQTFAGDLIKNLQWGSTAQTPSR